VISLRYIVSDTRQMFSIPDLKSLHELTAWMDCTRLNTLHTSVADYTLLDIQMVSKHNLERVNVIQTSAMVLTHRRWHTGAVHYGREEKDGAESAVSLRL